MATSKGSRSKRTNARVFRGSAFPPRTCIVLPISHKSIQSATQSFSTWFPGNFASFALVVEVRGAECGYFERIMFQMSESLFILVKCASVRNQALSNLYGIKLFKHLFKELFNMIPREVWEIQLGCWDKNRSLWLLRKITIGKSKPSRIWGKRVSTRNLRPATYRA